MTKLPDWRDLGALPRVSAERPVGSYDVGAYARGAQVLAHGTEGLGHGLDQLGVGVGHFAAAAGQYQYAQARAKALSQKIDLDAAIAGDQDYTTLPQRYRDALTAIRDAAAAGIGTPEWRDRFVTDMEPILSQGIASVQQRASNLESNANTAHVREQGEKFIDQAAALDDPAVRGEILDRQSDLIDGLSSRGFVKPSDAVSMKQDFASKYLLATSIARSSRDPQALLDDLDTASTDAADQSQNIFRYLPQQLREQLQNRAQTELQKRNAEGLANLHTRVEATLAEADNTGAAAGPVSQDEFVSRLGPQDGLKAFQAYSERLQYFHDLHAVAQLSSALPVDSEGKPALDADGRPMSSEQQALLQTYAPKPSEGSDTAAYARYDRVLAAIRQSNQERDQDPAAFAIKYLPVVQDAYRIFSDVMSDATASLSERQQAACNLAVKMRLEQDRIGVAPDRQRVVPQSYIDDFAARLLNSRGDGSAPDIAKAVAAEKIIWGPDWSAVYRQAADFTGPAFRVIGAGIKPLAAQVLSQYSATTVKDVLSNADDLSEVQQRTQDAFAPLAFGIRGDDAAMRHYQDFEGQGAKLAAFYVTRGLSPAEAADRAFDDLLPQKDLIDRSDVEPENADSPVGNASAKMA